ncbi:hypothetical protein B0H16DRAFT_1586328 [Mycena metata]|uniref:Uncharacterized protein n=1 Tax=Mycena metata TaxID=1033252 RepID=A0AAD7MRR7_9AGAR|nr:hypothetical protein B0H16DRAFT_1586328 [Mycena metata]
MEEFEAVFDNGPPKSMRKRTNMESRNKRKQYMAKSLPPKITTVQYESASPLSICDTCRRSMCTDGVTATYGPPPSPDILIPDGIENAPEFEDISLQLEAVDMGLKSIGEKLEKLYVSERDREAQMEVVRLLFEKFRHLRVASRNPGFLIAPHSTAGQSGSHELE